MIKIRNLSKTFEANSRGEENVNALRDINLDVNKGDIYGIIGMSGAGKSTLIRTMNMLERPTSGKVYIDGVDISSLKDKDLRKVRRKVTMIFQHFNLMMQRNVIENIMLPLKFEGVKKEIRYEKAMEALKLVGLLDKEKAYPSQLSGGQRQRIAIARALVTRPEILLCDEATSALDPKTSLSILKLLEEINREYGITIVLITHQMSVVEEICNKVAILDGGYVVEEGLVSQVFSNPKSNAAKRLVFPDGFPDYDKDFPDDHVIRIVFNGAKATKEPLISKMGSEKNIQASIISAQTKSIHDRMYGSIVLLLPGEDGIIERAEEYLSSFDDITLQVIKEKKNV